MDNNVGLPASRERGPSVLTPRKEPEYRFEAKSLMDAIRAQKPGNVWDDLPGSLKNARDKGRDSDPGREGVKMAGQFAKVTTANPLVHEFLDRRIVRITGPIDDATAANVIAMMQLLEDLAPDQDIELRINSPGGSVTAGLAIHDAMKMLRCDVKTVCEGECASMAAFLLATGTPGKRFAMPNSTIMVHAVSASMRGTYQDMKITMKEVERLETLMLDLFTQYTGLSDTQMEAMMNRDHFMCPAEAKALGLIDDVVQPRHKPPFPRLAAGPQPVAPPPSPAPLVH